MPSDYRLAPPLAARLLGISLVGWALLLFVATALVLFLEAPVMVLTVVVVLTVLGIAVTGALVTRRWYVVRLTDDGYRVRFVRGSGTTEGRWRDVEDAVTDFVAGAPCVVLRLRDGRSTTIPVEVLAGDKEQFVRDVRGYLDRAHGR